jgi:ABC-type thiamin/hydroxymethylpyrimidine transport system permease subunit
LVRIWRFSGRELGIIFAIGILTPLVDDRIEHALFQFLFSLPGYVSISNYVFDTTGGPVLGDLLQTWEQYGAVLAAFVVRKPGSGTIAMTINGFGQVFLNGTHAPHLLYGVAGLGADLAFVLFRYKRYDVRIVALAGLFAGLFWYPIVYLTHGVYLYPISFIAIDLLGRVFGSMVGNGLLGAAIGVVAIKAYNRATSSSRKVAGGPKGLMVLSQFFTSVRLYTLTANRVTNSKTTTVTTSTSVIKGGGANGVNMCA